MSYLWRIPFKLILLHVLGFHPPYKMIIYLYKPNVSPLQIIYKFVKSTQLFI